MGVVIVSVVITVIVGCVVANGALVTRCIGVVRIVRHGGIDQPPGRILADDRPTGNP